MRELGSPGPDPYVTEKAQVRHGVEIGHQSAPVILARGDGGFGMAPDAIAPLCRIVRSPAARERIFVEVVRPISWIMRRPIGDRGHQRPGGCRSRSRSLIRSCEKPAQGLDSGAELLVPGEDDRFARLRGIAAEDTVKLAVDHFGPADVGSDICDFGRRDRPAK